MFRVCVQGYFAEQDEGSTPQTPMDPSEQPEEKLSFALGNGSVGILAVKGRKVKLPLSLFPLLLTPPYTLPVIMTIMLPACARCVR